jgi:hypothetical protein
MDMLMRTQNGGFKAFKHLNDWWEEFRLYHRVPHAMRSMMLASLRESRLRQFLETAQASNMGYL